MSRASTTIAPSWGTIITTAAAGIAVLGVWRVVKTRSVDQHDPETTDPGLLRKHTTYASYTTPTATYPKIRTVYHPHAQATKLPADLPLLVFIHGLGGSSAQYVPLLTSLINAAPCLAIDLPGCGLSEFKPDDVGAYTTKAFAELVAAAIDRHRAVDQKIIIIGHSMGCSIASLLASSTSPLSDRFYDAGHIAGVVAICPKSGPPPPEQARTVKRLKYLPVFLLDALRFYDGIGGINSKSVLRFVGKDADEETRKLQLRYNKQSKSAVFLRYVASLANEDEQGKAIFPGKEIWSGIKVPLFLIAAEGDHLNPPADIETIGKWLENSFNSRQDSIVDVDTSNTASAIPTEAADIELAEEQLLNTTGDAKDQDGPPTLGIGDVREHQITTRHSFALKKTVFPRPASHALPYDTATVRILLGIMQKFISTHCDERLSYGWQLQHLTTSGKWDVKNLLKWQNTLPISPPVGGIFRAMKTMREVDEGHTPKVFVKKYSYKVLSDGVQTIIDTSHENPVYDPAGLEEGGVAYEKYPIVSKLPPSMDEVNGFIALVDRLREAPKMVVAREAGGKPTIGVHCHYGYNRTGFFICSYLIERLNYKVAEAIAEFKDKKPPGIKHDHFINELYVRYGMKLERRNTLVG